MVELPTGTVTFLFTDLEDSTRLWEERPDEMRGTLARHDELLRGAIESHDGRVVKKTGDGFHAAFARANDAIGAAIDAQRALSGEPWEASVPVKARMGIHSGPAEVRDGDYDGTAVNKAARLMSIAHGGQIVVSLATEQLVQDDEIELVDLGEHALRGLARPERDFQVAHEDLVRDFPRLLSVEASPGNIPAQVTSFVGRDDDVARVVASLEDASLVTLTGTGGVGKTRLAVQVGIEVAPGFSDGAWFCELAAVDDADAMAQVISSSLGCLQRPGLSLAESIVEYLRSREVLLVLDNCEHLLDDAGDLAEAVVRSCPSVRVVATSREALDVAGERVVRVRSLPAPEPSVHRREVIDSPAVQLFVDRAVDAGADPEWDDAQWAAIGEICRRVDGIPLAIELAAARTTSMSPSDVAAHLDERFRLLTGKRRGRVERHQTLRATVEWSYQLLTDQERTVFSRFGVFAGTFDAPAAVAVGCGDDLDAWEVTDALSSLVAKSMLVPETGPDGTTRYGMLETLRQFARERLDEAGDTDHWRRASATHYAMASREIGRGLIGPDHVAWALRLRADLDNVRAAIGWALERDDPADSTLALTILAWLEEAARTYPDMGLGALAAQAIGAADESSPELLVPVLASAAYYVWNQGETDRARALVRDAMKEGIVATTINPFAPFMGAVVFDMASGDPQALDTVSEVRAALDSVDNSYARAGYLGSICTFESMAGQTAQARADAAQGLELARRTGNVAVIGANLHGTAWALHREDPAAALAACEEFIDIYGEFGINRGSASSVLGLAGGLRARLGDDPGAIELLRRAVALARDQGVRPQFIAALDWSLTPLTRTGRPEVAAAFLGALTRGSLAEPGTFPGVASARARSLERLRDELGDETETHVARGSAMSYEELADYALRELDPERAG
jgi:predicted ATPase/class 3 adenylate cyclase